MNTQQIDHVEQLTKVIGATWSIRILSILVQKDARFTEIANEIGVSRRVLSLRLSELQDLELVVKNQLPVVPVQATYSLSKKGISLVSLLVNFFD